MKFLKVSLIIIISASAFTSYGIEYRPKKLWYELKMVGREAPIKKWEVGKSLGGGEDITFTRCPGWFYVSPSGAIFIFDRERGGHGSKWKPRIIVIEDSLFTSFTEKGYPFGDIPKRIFSSGVRSGYIRKFDLQGNLIKEFHKDTLLIEYFSYIENGNICYRSKNSNALKFFSSDGEFLHSVNAERVDPKGRLYKGFKEIVTEEGKTKKMISLEETYQQAFLISAILPEFLFDKYGNKYKFIIVSQIKDEKIRERILEGEEVKGEYGMVSYDINGNELGKISFKKKVSLNPWRTIYAYVFVDFYGNIYVSECTDKYRISKYAKIHLLPGITSSLKTLINDLRIDDKGETYYKKDGNWNDPPPSLPSKGGYELKEYSYEPKKINEIGFKVIENGEVSSKERLFIRGYENPIKELKYLGTDESGANWVYVEIAKVRDGKAIKGRTDWVIYRESKSKEGKVSLNDYIGSRYLELVPGESIPGVMSKDKIELLTIRVGYDGFLYFYKKEEKKWFKMGGWVPHSIEETQLKEIAPQKQGVEVKQYTIYEDIDPIELERGIEIKKGNESVRKFKYYYQDTLYTVQNLGLDDKNNIYVYVNWFDWLTKDKMKEVVKFNTKGEFQNRINLTANETPVLGLDGYIYTYENGGKAIVRKYEGKTLPEE